MKVESKYHISVVAIIAGVACAVAFTLFLLWLAARGSFSLTENAIGFLCVFLFCFAAIKAVPQIEESLNIPKTRVDTSGAGFVYVCMALWILLINGIFIAWAFSRANGAGLQTALEGIWYNTIDANNYAEIAESWYCPVEGSDLLYKIVFFPLYPIIMRVFQTVLRIMPLAGMAVSSVFAFLSGVMLYKLVLNDSDSKQAANAVKFMFIFPSAFFLMVPMTESLFLFLTISFIYMLAKKKYALAGVAGFLAALTRSQGILLVIPFAAEFLSDLRKSQGKFAFKDIVRKGIFIFGAPLGLLGYLLINYSVYRNPFQFMIFQNQNWNSSISWFWNTAVYLTDYFFYYLRKGDIRLILGLSIPNILALWGTLALIAAGAKKRRASLTLYSLAYFAMCFGHSWLLSGPRYALCLFPVFMTLAELVKGRKWLNNTVTAAMLFMFAAYLSFFISRYGVV